MTLLLIMVGFDLSEGIDSIVNRIAGISPLTPWRKTQKYLSHWIYHTKTEEKKNSGVLFIHMKTWFDAFFMTVDIFRYVVFFLR